MLSHKLNSPQRPMPLFWYEKSGLGVSEQTYYRWRREYGGMKTSQAKRLKELEKENQRLKRAVTDLTVDNMILKEASKGNF